MVAANEFVCPMHKVSNREGKRAKKRLRLFSSLKICIIFSIVREVYGWENNQSAAQCLAAVKATPNSDD